MAASPRCPPVKLLYYDTGDPLDCYDNPNCFFDTDGLGKRREPGDPGYVEWFPPGYTPPQPEPKPRRRRARPSSSIAATEPQTTSTSMNSFQIVIVPNPKNPQRPFRARAKLGPQVGQDEYLDAVVADAADAAITRAVVEKVLRSAFKVMIGYLRQIRPIGYILGLFRALPSITGSFVTNEPSADELKTGVGFTLNPGPDADAAMTDALTIETVGEEGTVTPEIDSTMLSPGGQVDKYSTTAALKVSGDHFRGSGQGQPWCLAYLVNDDGSSPVALAVFACSQTELLVSPAAAGTTGIKRLKIVAGWDTDLYVVSGPLTLAT